MIARFSKFTTGDGDIIVVRHDNIRWVMNYPSKGPNYSMMALESSERFILSHSANVVLDILREDSKS